MTDSNQHDTERANFVALGESARADMARLATQEMQIFLARCAGGLPLPQHLQTTATEWRANLSADRVADYCAAAASVIRSTLLDASFGADMLASGRIEELRVAPYFEVYARPGSLLAMEERLVEGGPVRLGVQRFASQIAARCGVDEAWGEVAWRSIVFCLPEAEASCMLPGLSVRTAGDGSLIVEVVNTLDADPWEP